MLANQALIAAFDPLLRRADKADVIGITTSVGEEPRAFWGGYGASKAAFDTLLGAYADETAHAGRLRVQIVDPGATRTRMRQLAFPGEEPDSVKARKWSRPQSSSGCRAMRKPAAGFASIRLPDQDRANLSSRRSGSAANQPDFQFVACLNALRHRPGRQPASCTVRILRASAGRCR